MNVREYLSVPYLLEAQAVERDGQWTRRLRYPELPGVEAEHDDVEQALVELERRRITEVMRRLRAGDPPPVPRSPLETTDQGWWARHLGLGALIDGQLDRDGADLAPNT
ncbi:hypothetical protein [Pararhodobacter zhoushanensis]|uniref:Uncharacterized protein n=1 Tax=Pararhodobacter zhoushanensis TaxID=2479545 RepID=A0ABT3H5M7_9RHOB|nr:hypothetical protein [Pararhodobacter zhoushanensis]MCW1935010.1 hypothetical protein [Pararhodobacter zhoushanensis]